MSELMKERTVVLVKPDGVKRGLSGEIISRLEKMGLKVVALKMIWVDKTHAEKHYPFSRTELMKTIGEKTLKSYEQYGKDPNEEFGTMDAETIGRKVNEWNMDFLTSGPVVAMLIEGVHAVDNVRMLVGNTMPVFSAPGTIRGDFSIDSPALANVKKRAVRNLMHASGNAEEAKYEEQLWFHQNEIYEYKRTDEDVMFG